MVDWWYNNRFLWGALAGAFVVAVLDLTLISILIWPVMWFLLDLLLALFTRKKVLKEGHQ